MPAIKGQKFKEYSYETKLQAIRLHVIEGWTYRTIMERFGITDRHRLKGWMRKYRENWVNSALWISGDDERNISIKTGRYSD